MQCAFLDMPLTNSCPLKYFTLNSIVPGDISQCLETIVSATTVLRQRNITYRLQCPAVGLPLHSKQNSNRHFGKRIVRRRPAECVN